MVFEPIGNTLDAVGAAQVRSRAKKTPEEKKEAKEQKDALWGEIRNHRDLLFKGALEIANKYNK